MRTICLQEAVEMIPSGATVMIGGFMGEGTPEVIVDELVRQKKRDLIVVANDTASPGVGIGKIVTSRIAKRFIVSHVGLNPETQRMMLEGEIEVELVPQRSLAERIRAAGCGLGGVLTATGLGTVVEAGKQKIEIQGKFYLVEAPLHADFALLNAFIADYIGNLAYTLTARHFNSLMAMAARKVVVAAENIVPVGIIAPNHVMTPAPLVDYLISRGSACEPSNQDRASHCAQVA